MHVVYRVINTQNQLSGTQPVYYIGSKVSYQPGYFGSSKHPDMIKMLETNPEVFAIELLEIVDDVSRLIERELAWQLKEDVVRSPLYYNLSYAKLGFSASGMKWYHAPDSKAKGLFPDNKAPKDWLPGQVSVRKQQVYQSKPHRRGAAHKDSKEWTLLSPTGETLTVDAIEPFFNNLNIRPSSVKYTLTSGKPVAKGPAKGWQVLRCR